MYKIEFDSLHIVFENCDSLSGTITIPGSITSIGNNAFNFTDVSNIIIKRANSTGLTLGTGWNGPATVSYSAY